MKNLRVFRLKNVVICLRWICHWMMAYFFFEKEGKKANTSQEYSVESFLLCSLARMQISMNDVHIQTRKCKSCFVSQLSKCVSSLKSGSCHFSRQQKKCRNSNCAWNDTFAMYCFCQPAENAILTWTTVIWIRAPTGMNVSLGSSYKEEMFMGNSTLPSFSNSSLLDKGGTSQPAACEQLHIALEVSPCL